MIVHQIPVGPMQNFSYIVVDEDSSESIIIDPSWNLMELELIIKENNLKIELARFLFKFKHMTSHQYKSLCCKLLIETSKNPVNTNWLFTILKDFYFLFRLHNFTLKGHLIKFLRQYDHQFISQSGFDKCLPMLKFSNLTGIYIPDSKCFWV